MLERTNCLLVNQGPEYGTHRDPSLCGVLERRGNAALFFEHYDRFVTKYFIYDNDSTDRSLEILNAHPRVTVRPLVLEGRSYSEAGLKQLRAMKFEESLLANWVTVCNIDEFFWHPDVLSYLEDMETEGVTLVKAEGYQMVSDHFPSSGEHLPATIKQGARFRKMDKIAFFKPAEVPDLGFSAGRHRSAPVGNVVRPKVEEVKLLHYKHLSLEYVLKRHSELNKRRRVRDVKKNYGYHYSEDVTLDRHALYKQDAINVVDLFTNAYSRPLKGS